MPKILFYAGTAFCLFLALTSAAESMREVQGFGVAFAAVQSSGVFTARAPWAIVVALIAGVAAAVIFVRMAALLAARNLFGAFLALFCVSGAILSLSGVLLLQSRMLAVMRHGPASPVGQWLSEMHLVGYLVLGYFVSLSLLALRPYFRIQASRILSALVFLPLPILPLLLVIIYLFRDSLRAAFGPELGIFLMIVGVIGVLTWMPVARLVRASFLSLKQKEFVEAARSIGAKDRRIIVRHILPNVLSPVLVAATIGVGGAILTESTLSFLGLGFPPDMPTWGRILFDARNYLDIAPHWAIFPGLCIFLTVLSINFIGDGLTDALNPRKTS